MKTAKSSGCLRRSASALLVSGILAQHCGSAVAGDTERAGDVLRVALPAAALALTFKHHDRPGRPQLYRAFGANVLGTWALKEAVDKKRPDGTGSDAFPSGHASMAFQGAAFIHRRYGIRSAWPAYALATLTAWTRVDADEHDTADVLAGAAVGIASSFLLVERWDSNVTAFATRDTIGIRISARF
jgi:membrane-associated phospholipid phosphatase